MAVLLGGGVLALSWIGWYEATGTDQRLTDLETKASFTEDLLDKLDCVIVRQQQQIDSLIREIPGLKQRVPMDGGWVRYAAFGMICRHIF